MKSIRAFFLVLLVAMIFVSASSVGAHQAQNTSEPTITIINPDKDDTKVGLEMLVNGSVRNLSSGDHIWVFAARTDQGNIWWIQREAIPDPKTGEWSAHVVFGQQQDISRHFRIAVVTVNQSEHLKLQAIWEEAMVTGKWLPMRMPPTTSPPQIRKVVKVSHN